MKPILVVRVAGGLGNQLFIYSFGEFLSEKFNRRVKYDFTPLESQEEPVHGQINYLEEFKLSYEIASKQEITESKRLNFIKEKYREFQIFNRNIYVFAAKNLMFSRKYLQKAHSFLNKPLEEPVKYSVFKFKLDANESYYFHGNWETYYYSHEIFEQLTQELIDLRILSANSIDNLQEIISKNNISTSIHFRKGDTGSKPHTKFKWYRKAIKQVLNEFPTSDFIVFSNDIPWVKQNFSLPDSSICINHTDSHTAVDDLLLMSQCQNNIICDSTFSYWGALLNLNREKLVIGPKYKKYADARYTDAYPPNWRII